MGYSTEIKTLKKKRKEKIISVIYKLRLINERDINHGIFNQLI